MKRAVEAGRGRRLQPLLEPESVTIIGASTDAQKISGRPLRYLLRHGYKGRIYPVNAGAGEVLGLAAYPEVRALPEVPDLAVICVPAARVPAALEACGEHGIPAAVVLSAGFAETGEEGARLQAQAASIAARSGMFLCGPNSVGVINVWRRLTASFSAHLEEGLLAGPIAFVSQSGAMGTTTFNRMQDEGLGFSYFVSSGNQALLEAVDFIEAFLHDDHTEVVAAYIEGVRDGSKVLRVGRLARELGKPIVVLKAGRTDSGRRAALSHTAAVTGSHAVYRTAFRQAGIVMVEDIEELVDACRLLSQHRSLPGARMAVISGSGGVSVLAADHFAKAGLEIPLLSPDTVTTLQQILPPFAACQNPVDVTGQLFASPRLLQAALATAAQDPSVDGIALVLSMAPPDAARRMAEDIVLFAPQSPKPLAVGWLGGSMVEEGRAIIRKAGIPLYTTLPALAAGLRILVEAGRRTQFVEAAHSVGVLPAPRREALERGGILPYLEARALLDHIGIEGPREAIVRDADEAVENAAQLGFPVAVKLLAPALSHKSEAGAVRVNLTTAHAVREAVGDLLEVARTRLAGEPGEGLLVQQMITGGSEFLLGLVRDAQFGNVLTLGAGGILVEVLRDVVHGLPPLSRGEAERMIGELAAARILDGVRGQPRRDREALIDALLRLSTLAETAGDAIEEMDINPLIVREEGRGAFAVDVRVVGRRGL
ncbi:MAG: acetate--CoA ligase family protein [Candidatus Rokubacteria bacterium]|nr:acetate--CoA ligase family protein [Candidatus Rokubacteria bacterium]